MLGELGLATEAGEFRTRPTDGERTVAVDGSGLVGFRLGGDGLE